MKLCPNLDQEDGLETVLEVPIPEEMFNKMGCNAALQWHSLRNLMRAHSRTGPTDKWATLADPFSSASFSSLSSSPSSSLDNSNHNNDQFMMVLRLVGSAFIPYRAQFDHAITKPIKDGSIEASTAKYIVQQYIAATGGLASLNAINSMYAVGQVKMVVASACVHNIETVKRSCEAGGFVLWQMNPDLWYHELVVSGNKVSSGSDGKIAWSQSSSSSVASKGPPRPLRRFFQGLDPRSTANLFLHTLCIGEKLIKDEDCFVLKLETSPETLKAQSTPNTEIVYHTIWGYFSQRSGLLIQFEDAKLIRMKAPVGNECVFYETSMETTVEDYRVVDGIKIAHSGKTSASLYRYGKTLKRQWKVEERWMIEEIDFNICGLSVENFLPPADVKNENEVSDNGI